MSAVDDLRGHEDTLEDIASDEDAPDAPFARLVLSMLRDESIDEDDLDALSPEEDERD